jgi:tRNA-dihydrouridine synthase
MIGRGVFGNPWIFTGRSGAEIPIEERYAFLVELAHAFERLTPKKNFAILKKHIKAFVTGFDGASELRAKLMECENAVQLEAAVRSGEGKFGQQMDGNHLLTERARQGA